MRRRGEAYAGRWLPGPLPPAPEVAEDVELTESVSMAMMLVPETPAPTERAVSVLRGVFDVGYGEIAQAAGENSAAVHQIAHRARRHVKAHRPRQAALTAGRSRRGRGPRAAGAVTVRTAGAAGPVAPTRRT
jgi:RNA polymerase sigma-70 factor (ECF subfamily)